MQSPYPQVPLLSAGTSVPAPPDGPPPPPAPPGSDSETRATAAAWVAGTGALLLLAAAATFLAVSWDTMGLAARVTVVGAVTGTAILGGHRLRRRLPAVGSAIYHLGALLVPVDALGLALQVGLAPAGRWLTVGLVAMAVLMPLAVAGRSHVLAWAAVAGVPVAATGAAFAGVVEARVSVVAVATAALLLPRMTSGRLSSIGRGAAPALAGLAALLPAVVAAVLAIPGASGAVRQFTAAGWAPGAWTTTVGVGTLAVAVMAVAASAARSRGLATLACFTTMTTVVTVLLPTATPRLAVLLVPALAAVAIESAAMVARSDGLWGAPIGRLAGAVEVVGSFLVVEVVAIAAVPWLALPSRSDGELAAVLGVLAAAWAVAAVRRGIGAGWQGSLAPAMASVAGAHVAAALAAAGLRPPAAMWMLVGTAAMSLAWSGLSPRLPLRGAAAPPDAAGHVATVSAGVALAAAGLASLGSSAGSVVPLAVALVVGLHLRSATRAGRSGAVMLRAVMTPAAVGLVLLSSAGVAVTGSAAAPMAGVVAAGALLCLAALLDDRPVAADAVRIVAAAVGFVVVLPSWPDVATPGIGTASGEVVALLRLTADALVPTLVVAGWLVVDAVRVGRPRIAAFAAPVFVRFAGAALLAVGAGINVAGAMLWTIAVTAAVAAVLGPGRWMPAAVTVAAVAAPAGWLLVGDDPGLRAALLVASGSLIAVGGVLRRRPTIGHLGAAVATFGIWQVLILDDVVALDVWLLPVAAQLWVAGTMLRRRDGTSSWITDVPPMLLLAVPAVLERVAGGPGWHAVLAGGVALVAVVAGGAERLGGPLIAGTVLLVTVVGIETFAVVAAVPTWAWLAAGGATLLGAAVAIERAGGSPASAARRFLDVVSERFD